MVALSDRQVESTVGQMLCVAMSASGVRRGKAALSSGCKPHPVIAPAGSNRSSHGGDEMAEAFGYQIEFTAWQGGFIASGYPGCRSQGHAPYEAVNSPKGDVIAGGVVGERNRVVDIK